MRELNEAYNHFFFHYTATPLLVVETSQFDLSWGEEALADLERQLRGMGKGTQVLRAEGLTRRELRESSELQPTTPSWLRLPASRRLREPCLGPS